MVAISRSLSLISVLLASAALAQANVQSQNAAARAHSLAQRNLEGRGHYASRAVTLDGGKRFRTHRRRATQDQIDAQNKLNAWNDNFHAQNTAWQKAAMEQLKEGKTPQSFDEFVASQSGSSDSSSSTPLKKESDDSEDESDDGSHDESDDDDEQDHSGSNTPSSSSAAPKATKSSKSSKQHQSSKGSNSSSNQSSGSSSGGSGLLSGLTNILTGQGTFYNTGLGSCGWTNNDSDYIVAISHGLMDSLGNPSDPNNNPACGKKIRATLGDKSVDVTVSDRCGGCAWGDLDFSPAAFKQLADESVGRFDNLKWAFIDGMPN